MMGTERVRYGWKDKAGVPGRVLVTARGDRIHHCDGERFLPYGIEPNRRTLDAFLRYCVDHGVAHRAMQVEELVAPEVLAVSRT